MRPSGDRIIVLDRDDDRIPLQIDEEAPDVALMIASSPCVDAPNPR